MSYAAANTKARTQYAQGIAAWLPHGHTRSFARAWVQTAAADRDMAHYMCLWKLAQRLDAYNKRAILPILGTEIDLRNIVWLYRLTHFHGLSGDAVFAHLIPVRWRLTQEYLRRLAGVRTEDFLETVKQGHYSWVFADFSRPEKAIQSALLRIYKRQAIAYPHSFAWVVTPW